MKSKDRSERDQPSTPVVKRKAYQKPQLVVYGELGELTQNNTLSGKADGTGHPNKHFTT